MPRTLAALAIALGVHGLLLVADLPPIRKKPLRPPVPRVITMTLGYRQPEKPPVETREIEPPKPVLPESIPLAPQQVEPAPKEPERKVPPRKKRVRRPAPRPKTPAQSEALVVPREPVSPPPELAKPVDRGSETEVKTVMEEAKPLYRLNRPPPYPRVARRRGYEGTVVLEVLVNRKGRVGELRVFSSSGYTLLDKAAMAAVEDWLFEPGRRGEESVAMWVRVPIRFVLD